MIFVDNYQRRFGRLRMCHMLSDSSLDELHAFASRLQIPRSWFHNATAPHYYVSKSKRAEAICLGASKLRIREDRLEWRRVAASARLLKSTAAWESGAGQRTVQSDGHDTAALSADTIAELSAVDVFFEGIRHEMATCVGMNRDAVHKQLVGFSEAHGWAWEPIESDGMRGHLKRGASIVRIDILAEGIALHSALRSEVVMTAY